MRRAPPTRSIRDHRRSDGPEITLDCTFEPGLLGQAVATVWIPVAALGCTSWRSPSKEQMVQNSLHGAVRALLEAHLTDYRKLRKRFPLWTYSRHRPTNRLVLRSDGTRQEERHWCWEDSRAWWERLRWSQRSPYLAVVHSLHRALEPAGYVAAAGALENPRQAEVAVFYPEGGPPIELPVPLELRARTLAIFAAMDSPDIPATATEVRLPEQWSRCWLDDVDVEQLGRRLARVLCYPRAPKTLRRELKLPESASLLNCFLNVAHRQQVASDDRDRKKLRDVGTRLSEVLTRRSGIVLGERGGGRRTDLEPKFFRQLRMEARELVGEVREHGPGQERLELYADVLLADGSISLKPAGLAQLERARRGGDPPRGLLILRFPFLAPAEVDRIRRRSDHRWTEPAGTLADDLLNRRLTANLSRRTIRRRVADAPKSLFEELFPTS